VEPVCCCHKCSCTCMIVALVPVAIRQVLMTMVVPECKPQRCDVVSILQLLHFDLTAHIHSLVARRPADPPQTCLFTYQPGSLAVCLSAEVIADSACQARTGVPITACEQRCDFVGLRRAASLTHARGLPPALWDNAAWRCGDGVPAAPSCWYCSPRLRVSSLGS
jgi:hypothetical protein